ncbi:uncharacterized protein PV07_04765 [Cladophialophora immunda]|uniref:Uncharacterized protein n=1 Tax=Cladophialophora immunda TaxID=569365 RepID=A0A0D1ZLS7_9EURO|nr:uncharacterized protein PV07_04765 [Cladophialophora immunda]KIW28911.1 hypothetical protein PV07_04765 [Cladophialophora immunda]
MDENILQNLAAQRSQECQLIDLTLGRLKKLHESEVAILGDLYREDRWRWTPEHGLQVGLPQDLEVRWFSRESVLDLQNRVRPLTLPDGEPDPNADRRLERQEYVWLLSQMLHYELGFALTPIDATARIATALRAGNVRQPRKLKHRAQKLRGDYRLRNSDLDSESAVNEETSTSGFDAQPEREQQLENGGTENGTGTTLSSAESDLKRRLVVGKARADTEAIIPGPMERDVGTGARAVQVREEELQCNSNANEQYGYKRDAAATVTTTGTRQTPVTTRSNLRSPAKRPWVSHSDTLQKTLDPLPPAPRPVQFSEQVADKHAKSTQTFLALGRAAPAPPRTDNDRSFEEMSRRVSTDNTKTFSAAKARKTWSPIETSTVLDEDTAGQNRSTTPVLEGITQSLGNEYRAGGFRYNVLQRPHESPTQSPQTGTKHLAMKDTGPWISGPDKIQLLRPKNPAPTTEEMEQVNQPGQPCPVYIVIEDSDSEHHSEHPHRGKGSSIRRLKKRKPCVKAASALGTFYATRSIFLIPPSDIGGDDGAQLSGRRRSLSSAPSRISAIFPQTKRTVANRTNLTSRVAAKVRVGRHTPDVCTSKTRPTRQSEDNSDPLERIPFGYIRSTESKSRHGDPPEAGAAANGFPPKIRRAPSPWNRNLSNRIQVSSLQQENLKLVQKATVNLYSPQSAKTVSLKKAEVPKKAESPKRTQIPGTALTVSDNYALNAKVEEVCKDTDKVVEELRHSSQTVVRSFKPPRKNKRPHSAAFSEHGGSRKGGKRKPNSTNTTYDLVERTTPGAPKSAIPRDNDVPIFPRMEYLMGCDRNGVPAKRAPFRRPTPLTHTLRDQSDAARIQERKRAIGADSPNHLLRGVG